jgi:hypothetical protein
MSENGKTNAMGGAVYFKKSFASGAHAHIRLCGNCYEKWTMDTNMRKLLASYREA